MSSPIYEYAATLWRDMRAEFQDVLEAAYAKAEEGAHGKMLNAEGRREGIDAFSLLTGAWSRVERYASPELIEWFENEGRPSLDRFEREWMSSWLGEMPEPEETPDDWPLPPGTTVQARLAEPDGWPADVPWPALKFGEIRGYRLGVHVSDPENLCLVEFPGVSSLYVPRSSLVVTR